MKIKDMKKICFDMNGHPWFEEFPEILEILYSPKNKCEPELRIKKSQLEKEYNNGKKTELNLASKELKSRWPEISAKVKSQAKNFKQFSKVVFIWTQHEIISTLPKSKLGLRNENRRKLYM